MMVTAYPFNEKKPHDTLNCTCDIIIIIERLTRLDITFVWRYGNEQILYTEAYLLSIHEVTFPAKTTRQFHAGLTL